jgi:nitrogen fixation protein FixH
MNQTLPTLFGGLAVVLILFSLTGRLPHPVRALIAAGIPLLGYFVYIIGRWPGLDVVAIHVAVYSSAALVMLMIKRFQVKSGGKLHWAPKALVVFFLLLTLLMAGFLYISTQGLPPWVAAMVLPGADKVRIRTGFSGVLEHGQEAAKTINSQLSEQYRQNRLGWDVAVQGLRVPSKGDNSIVVEAGDADGRPLTGLTAMLYAKRPGEAGEGMPQIMHETTAGTFEARLHLPASGLWLVSLSLTRGEERHHQEWEVRVP